MYTRAAESGARANRPPEAKAEAKRGPDAKGGGGAASPGRRESTARAELTLLAGLVSDDKAEGGDAESSDSARSSCSCSSSFYEYEYRDEYVGGGAYSDYGTHSNASNC